MIINNRKMIIASFFLLLILSSLSSSCAYAQENTPNPQQSPAVINSAPKENIESYFIDDIKYLNQNEKGTSKWCVVYSVAMALSHYKIYKTPEEIASALDMPTRSNYYFSWKSTFADKGSVERYIRDTCRLSTQKKIFVKLHPDHQVWIKNNLKSKSPIIILYGGAKGHAVVAVGYDDKNIYINDPSGSLFAESTRVLKKNMFPVQWKAPDHVSYFDGAAMSWDDFDNFLDLRNGWGYMIAVKKPDKISHPFKKLF